MCASAPITGFLEIHFHSEWGKFPVPSAASQSDLRGARYQTWGAPRWRPAESQCQVVGGAYFTQNATNVERALDNLPSAHRLTMEDMRNVRAAGLELLIRPGGYFRQGENRLLQGLPAALITSNFASSRVHSPRR